MKPPSSTALPFFAYGVFRPGQIGFFRLKSFVVEHFAAEIPGELRIRDGLPLVDKEGSGRVEGRVLVFESGAVGLAYQAIANLEPEHQYRWESVGLATGEANVLFGKSPKKGSIIADRPWDSWSDPLFNSALDVVEEVRDNGELYDPDLRPLFRLQMAYLLLWSSIERYVSLRYHLADDATAKVKKLADEQAFVEALAQYGGAPRQLFRSHLPKQCVTLSSNEPASSIDYYYQLRSNIIHRGKAADDDHQRLAVSLQELTKIFRHVLRRAQAEAAS